jgi:hypothetical protein
MARFIPHPIGRRALLGLPAALLTRRAGAAAGSDPLPAIPVLIRAAGESLPTAFIDEQLAAASTLLAGADLRFTEVGARGLLAASHAMLETRDDRDAFAKYFVRGTVNVFVVQSLRDVDDPSRLRKGVTWRCLRALAKRYVIVSTESPPPVLAHELGHFFSLGHSRVKNNLMSYEREEGATIFLDAAQTRAVRATARAQFANGDLAAAPRLWKKQD